MEKDESTSGSSLVMGANTKLSNLIVLRGGNVWKTMKTYLL